MPPKNKGKKGKKGGNDDDFWYLYLLGDHGSSDVLPHILHYYDIGNRQGSL
jgi:hypothetical protein